ncbi:MAG: hypothetical protein KC550_03215 [Nanoarchaeota archaeon]|nr:hypothetical protein [Nanoarchaeota archaeon]
MKEIKLHLNGKEFEIKIKVLEDTKFEITTENKKFIIELKRTSTGILLKEKNKEYEIILNNIKSHFYDIYINGIKNKVELDSRKIAFEDSEKMNLKKNFSKIISSPITGTISKVFCKKNQKIKTGEELFSLIAMKMENKILATNEGTIKNIFVKENDKVFEGEKILEFE